MARYKLSQRDVSKPRRMRSPSPIHTTTHHQKIVVPAPATRRAITLKETHAEYGRSVEYWRERCLRGELSYTKLGGPYSQIYIPREAIEKFIAARTVKGKVA